MKKCEKEGCNAPCMKYDHCSRHRPKKVWPSRKRTPEEQQEHNSYKRRARKAAAQAGTMWEGV